MLSSRPITRACPWWRIMTSQPECISRKARGMVDMSPIQPWLKTRAALVLASAGETRGRSEPHTLNSVMTTPDWQILDTCPRGRRSRQRTVRLTTMLEALVLRERLVGVLEVPWLLTRMTLNANHMPTRRSEGQGCLTSSSMSVVGLIIVGNQTDNLKTKACNSCQLIKSRAVTFRLS